MRVRPSEVWVELENLDKAGDTWVYGVEIATYPNGGPRVSVWEIECQTRLADGDAEQWRLGGRFQNQEQVIKAVRGHFERVTIVEVGRGVVEGRALGAENLWMARWAVERT